ncbi:MULTISPECIES: wax ester/triacylglycerol synthase domain-containing protein [unclassified Mycobacterium]|uniref:wax ester/triacylglycerol synthase domain-containing protein n=1 Tax=unclassified Mycobacterium TaxID=2642494 RepID=UPI000802384A|nr:MULTISPECIES: wax ester/triacylglycerol synthase domain-containing protein [unclassified Mycobacterium]OBH02786.1 diacylglycerol O-acyltransferase [Mycobacterium sp. E2699]OBI47392.1 diacylglycerol O-acyltransferase [Mycobacterium sp. E787]
MTGFLRNSDAFTWAMESDPRLRSTVVSVVLLDRSPDWDEVRERFDLISRKLPMFRQRVVPSRPPAPPHWEYAPDFDLDYHIRRFAAPGTGTLDDVLEMARLAEMQDFDRARPLWETTLIDGLGDGGAAMICKFHHALTDGIGGVQIAMHLFNLSEEQCRREPLPPEPDPSRPSWLAGYRDSWRYDAGMLASALAGAAKATPRLLYGGVRRPVATARSAAATAASVYRTVRPIGRTGSPLLTDRGLIRRLMVHQVPMQQLREAAHRSGGALNDAFVAGVAGGLRRYHEKHDVAIGDLHLTMPISLRTEADGMGGNRITLMRFDVPAGEVEPTARIRAIHERAGAVRTERSLPYTQLIAGALNLMPRWYIGSVLRHVDFLASDVPGVPVPVFLGGAPVRAQYAFGPTIGAAVNVTLLTYVDTCALGIDIDTAAIPDHDIFHQALVAGFDEVLALAA